MVATESPFPRTLNGVTGRFISPGGPIFNPRLYFVGQSQISGILDGEVSTGIGWLEFQTPGGTTNRARVRVTESLPRFFTLNQTGSGPVIFTHPNYDLVTRQNPARPGSPVVGWINNFGDRPGTEADKRNGPIRFGIDIGNQRVADEALLYFGRSGPGYGQFNINNLPDNGGPGSCAEEVRMFFDRVLEGFRLISAFGTIAMARSGACSDPLGFSAEDWSWPGGEGIDLADATVSEITSLVPNTQPRHFIIGTFSVTRWREQTYRSPPPPGSCQYRWQPQGYVDPFAPMRHTLTGSVRLTTPWGAFDYSLMSNNGPFSLAFSFPANFTEGNFSFNAPAGFTVGGQPFVFQNTGQYRRTAGLLREAFVQALSRVSPEERLTEFSNALMAIFGRIPREFRDPLYTDFNVQLNDGSRGTHLIRCVADAAGDHSFIPTTLENYAPMLPKIANDSLIAVRFLPKARNRFDVTVPGPIDRVHVNFDATVQFSGMNLRTRE